MIGATRYSPIGLDLRETRVHAAQLARTAHGFRVHALADLPIDVGALAPESGRPLEHVMDLLMRRGFRGDRVVLAAPRGAVRSSVVNVPPGAAGPALEAIARSELSRAHNLDPSSFELACWPLPGAAGARVDSAGALAFACPHEALLGTVAQFDAIGFDVVAVDLKSQAIARACLPLIGQGGGLLRVIVELGRAQSMLIVMIDSTVLYERSLTECSLDSLRSEIRSVLGVDDRAADRAILSRGLSGFGPESRGRATRVRSSLDDYVGVVAGELAMSIDYAARRHGVSDASEALLIGAGASMPGLAERLSESCDVPVRAIRPDALLAVSPGAGVSNDPSLVVAIGLACRSGGG